MPKISNVDRELKILNLDSPNLKNKITITINLKIESISFAYFLIFDCLAKYRLLKL